VQPFGVAENPPLLGEHIQTLTCQKTVLFACRFIGEDYAFAMHSIHWPAVLNKNMR
jgi:hypothetical protein